MKVVASAVFEHVVYNVRLLDRANPQRLSLVVDALIRAGDADAGPLLVPLPELTVAIGPAAMRPLLPGLRADGRIVDHQGVAHVSFTVWTRIDPDAS